MLSLRKALNAVFGRHTGPKKIRLGLLRGRHFVVGPSNQLQRLLGLSELEIAGTVRRHSRLARTAVDVGANDGWYTLYFASQRNIQTVLAIDPVAANRDSTMANLSANSRGLSEKVTFSIGYAANVSSPTTIQLDDLLSSVPEPIIIKIDIEGGEFDCLRGCARTLRAKNVCLVVETHSHDLERNCLAFVEEMGYKTRVVDNAWYRKIVPEHRSIDHNRWFIASKGPL